MADTTNSLSGISSGIDTNALINAIVAMKSGNIAVNPRASRQCDIEMLYRRAL